jgi:hypothetical protein
MYGSRNLSAGIRRWRSAWENHSSRIELLVAFAIWDRTGELIELCLANQPRKLAFDCISYSVPVARIESVEKKLFNVKLDFHLSG